MGASGTRTCNPPVSTRLLDGKSLVTLRRPWRLPRTAGSAGTTAGSPGTPCWSSSWRAGSWRRPAACSPRACSSRRRSRSCCPATIPGVVTLTRTQKRMGDLSLLLIGIRSPDHAGEPALRRGADRRSCAALPPTVVSARDLQRARPQRLLREEQVALRLGGRPRVDPRSPAHRDQQAQEPALRLAGRRRVDRRRCRSASSTQDGLDERFPGGVFTQQQRRVRLDRGAAAGRPVRRARGRGAVQRGARAHRRRCPRALSPADARRGRRADRHGDRQPPGGRATTSCGSPSAA